RRHAGTGGACGCMLHSPVSANGARRRAVARLRDRQIGPPGDRVRNGVVKLTSSFYERPTLEVAADLLGKVLVHRHRAVVPSGIMVEVEAYIGESAPACHAAAGRTNRNRPLYGPPGRAYVYLNYGIHCLVNVVTEPEPFPAAVLIRALDPLEGIEVMRRRRR